MTVSVWTFDTPEGASGALRVLERLQTRRRLTIDDASVVSWAAGRHRPHVYQVGAVDGTAALAGAFWGLLFGTVFLMPLVVPDAGGPAGLSAIGLSDEFLDQVRCRVVPGASALFLLTDIAVLDRIRDALDGAHGGLLVAPLAHEQDQLLRHVFGSDEPDPCP
jgi:uncharacterized membrane protein